MLRFILPFFLLYFPIVVFGQYQFKTIKVDGKVYKLSLLESGFYLKASDNHTFTYKSNPYLSFEIRDLNGDGFKDIYLQVAGTNTAALFEILEYNPLKKRFEFIKNMIDFPDPQRIEHTECFYSYHHNGCADETWVSDLFYIKSHKAYKIGTINAEGCRIKDGIYIYRLKSQKRTLIKSLPINTINLYNEYKWGFIKSYWTKSYRKFISK